MKMRYKPIAVATATAIAAVDDVTSIDSIRIRINHLWLWMAIDCRARGQVLGLWSPIEIAANGESERELMHYHLWPDKVRWIIYYVDHQRQWSASIICYARLWCLFILRPSSWSMIHDSWTSARQTQDTNTISALFLSFSHLWRQLNGDWMAA